MTEVDDESNDDGWRRGGRRKLSKETNLSIRLLILSARFQDDSLNGDDEVSTTNDGLCFDNKYLGKKT